MRFLKLRLSLFSLFFISRSFAQTLPPVNCTLTTSYSTCLSQSVSALAFFSATYTPAFVWTVSPGAGTVTLNSPQNSEVGLAFTSCGMHTVSVTGYSSNVVTCTATAFLKVLCTIASPSVAGSGNASVCPGYSTMLSATGAFSYTWNPGGIVQPTLMATAGLYTVVGSSTAGCTAVNFFMPRSSCLLVN